MTLYARRFPGGGVLLAMILPLCLASAALALLQVKDVPPPEPVTPSPNRLAQMLTLVSVLSTVGVGAWAALGVFRKIRA